MRPTGDFGHIIEEIHNGKLHFMCSGSCKCNISAWCFQSPNSSGFLGQKVGILSLNHKLGGGL